MKKIIFTFVLTLIIASVSLGAFASGNLPVLMYHNVTPDTSLVEKDATVHITPQRLEEHFETLKSAGYNAVSMEEYMLYREGRGTLPRNPVIITFDDGYTSNYEYAYPLLKKYDMKAIIFIIASRVGAENTEFPHFTWQQAIEMENSGLVEIESHSYTHPDFSTLSYAETLVEMRLAKYVIEKNMKKECRFFAYPYGKMNITSTSVAAGAGYKAVCVGRETMADASGENMFELPRFTIRGDYSGEDVIELIQ